MCLSLQCSSWVERCFWPSLGENPSQRALREAARRPATSEVPHQLCWNMNTPEFLCARGKEHRNVTVNRYSSILSRSELSHLSKFRNTEKYDFSYISRVLVQIYLLSFTCIIHIRNFILSYSGLVKNFSIFSNTS